MSRLNVVVCICGLAMSASASGQAELAVKEFHAAMATKIIAMHTDGRLVYGETTVLGQAVERGSGTVVAFDQFESVAVCTSSDLFSEAGIMHAAVEDVVAEPGTDGQIISNLRFCAERLLCDGGTWTTSEVCQFIVFSWEHVDNTADLDGSDGFATAAAGLVTPMERVDLDGDGFIDGFNGGIILTFADRDTNNDHVFDELCSWGGEDRYARFFASGLETLGVPMPTGVDSDGDGRPDGGVEMIITRGDGGDGLGPLVGGFYPATNSTFVFGATSAFDTTGCLVQNNLGQGSSNGTLWAEGFSECGGGDSWSDGSASTLTDGLYDPLVDLKNLDGLAVNPTSFGIALKIEVLSIGLPYDCCDVNNDGDCTSADFTAWIAAFNAGSANCDINQDGSCTPADFTAWIAAFNASQAGTPMLCAF